jgi:hypothetical protein
MDQLEAYMAGGPAGRTIADRASEDRRADGGVDHHLPVDDDAKASVPTHA